MHGDAGSVVLAARLLLAAVFALAAAGKLLDAEGASEAVRAFGGPARAARPIALALIAAELAVALGLIVSAAAWWAAIGAALLLVALSLAVARSLRRGERPDCHCFGQLHSARIGVPTLARNLLLCAIALAAVMHGRADMGASATAWVVSVGETGWVVVACGVACAATLLAGGWLATELLRRNGRLIGRVEQLETALVLAGLEVPPPPAPGERVTVRPGDPAPRFELPDLDGRPVVLADLLGSGRELALMFASTSCHPCRMLLRSLADRSAELPGGRRVVVIGEGRAEDWRSLPAELMPETVLLQRAGELAERYGAEVTPTAVVISTDGLVTAAPALGASAARTLLLDPPAVDRGAPARVPALAIHGVTG
ncbi:MAG: TlpA family protein disulfide reductase [Solirubrobacteraceae bacterium]